jgi:uncharacterized protein YkwD
MPVARARLAPAVVLLALIALMLLAPKAHGAAARCAPGGSDQDTPRALRLELRCLVNVERWRRGLPRLRPNGALFRAAGRHARDMVRRRYFSHYSRTGGGPTSRIAGTGYLESSGGWVVGENIAWQELRDPRWVVSSWMRSPSHRRILLSPQFRELGIGVAKASPSGDGRGLTTVVDFGRRKRG